MNELPIWDGKSTLYTDLSINTSSPVYSSVLIGDTITNRSTSDLMKSLTENYLKDHCYGITINGILDLIRKHQPERLL